jgi:hypothetical protein
MRNSLYKIDDRTRPELYRQITELAASYTPEWIFDPKNPDIGSVIAILFADQLNGSIDRFNQLIGKYRVELVNLMGIGLMPAFPADGICVFQTIQNVVPGVNVPAGTKLIGTGAEMESIIFETSEPIHVSSAEITDILQVSGCFGRIIPLRTDTNKVFPAGIPAPSGTAAHSKVYQDEIRLFDFSMAGIEQNSLLLYHENVFDVPDDTEIIIETTDKNGAPIAELLADPDIYRFRYYDGYGFRDYDTVLAKGGRISLRKDGPMQKAELPAPDGRLMDIVRIDAVRPVTEVLEIGSIRIHSMASGARPDFASNNENDLPADAFMPFGETASLFEDCYIGSDSVFVHDGAEVTIGFNLSFREKLVTYTAEQVEESLKVIKRKPRQVIYTTAHTIVNRITVEYFNGTGWRKLTDDEQWSGIFSGETEGYAELSFSCPESWEPVTIGAHTGRCLRLRIESADNCYLQPCIHRMPLITDLRVSYRYAGEKKKPSYIERISGTEKTDLTEAVTNGDVITAFSPLPESGNSLYLGFDRKIEGRPVSIYFGLREMLRGYGVPLSLEYSTNRGFKQMRVTDETDGLSKCGIIMMEPGEDIAKTDVYGQSRYWLRIRDEESVYNDPERIHPVITDILQGAVTIKNESTLDEDSYYIDEASPGMTFGLSATGILTAEVFVNESNMPKARMLKYMEARPQDTRAIYDGRGDISEFYIRWEEVQNFDASKPDDRHYVIDRLHNVIRFGDGAFGRIPAASSDPAFTVRVKRCDGAAGNLPEGAISGLVNRLLYIDEVRNPLPASGGSDMENVLKAIDRGADFLNTSGRLVSEADYVREALNYSEMIADMRCITYGGLGDSREAGRVDIALLMRDYREGSQSFDRISDGLRKVILTKCGATITAEQIHIIEPMYVKISIDVWVTALDPKKRFETETLIEEMIKKRIEPLPEPDGQGGYHGGYKIGELPTPERIDIMLHGIGADVVIKRFTATATYIDEHGMHSTELGKLIRQPFMLGVNDIHHVHFL